MKWVFVAGFFVATVLLILANVTAPDMKNDDVVAHLIWATDDNPARKEQMQLFREWHMKKYGEKIDISTSVLNYDATKIVIQSLAGTGPDVFDYGSSVQLERYVRSGIILDITEDAKANGYSTDIIWPGIRPSVEYEGRQYAFPDNAVNTLLFYHKDIFDEAGIPYPQDDWTWDEFINVAKKLTFKRGKKRQYALLSFNPFIVINQTGAKWFNPEGTRCIINSPEALAGLLRYYDLSAKHRVMPTGQELASMTSQGGWGGNINMFAAKDNTNRFAMMEGGRYLLIALVKDYRDAVANGKTPPQLNLGVVEFPRGKVRYGTGLARATGINKNSKQIKYAKRFLEFLASEPYNRQINRSYDALAPVIKYCQGPQGIADGPPPPPGLECANDPTWADMMMHSREWEISPYVSPHRVSTIYSEEITRLDLRVQTPETTLKKIEHRINEEIKRNIARDEKLRQQYEEAVQHESEASR